MDGAEEEPTVCLALLSAGVAEGPGVAEHRPSRAHAHLGALSERRKASVSVGGEEAERVGIGKKWFGRRKARES